MEGDTKVSQIVVTFEGSNALAFAAALTQKGNLEKWEEVLKEKAEALAKQENSLTERNQAVIAVAEEVSGREQEATRREQEATVRETEVSRRENEVTGRETEATRRESEVTGRETEATRREDEVSGREKEASRQENAAAKREQRIVKQKERLSARIRENALKVRVLKGKERAFNEKVAKTGDLEAESERLKQRNLTLVQEGERLDQQKADAEKELNEFIRQAEAVQQQLLDATTQLNRLPSVYPGIAEERVSSFDELSQNSDFRGLMETLKLKGISRVQEIVTLVALSLLPSGMKVNKEQLQRIFQLLGFEVAPTKVMGFLSPLEIRSGGLILKTTGGGNATVFVEITSNGRKVAISHVLIINVIIDQYVLAQLEKGVTFTEEQKRFIFGQEENVENMPDEKSEKSFGLPSDKPFNDQGKIGDDSLSKAEGPGTEGMAEESPGEEKGSSGVLSAGFEQGPENDFSEAGLGEHPGQEWPSGLSSDQIFSEQGEHDSNLPATEESGGEDVSSNRRSDMSQEQFLKGQGENEDVSPSTDIETVSGDLPGEQSGRKTDIAGLLSGTNLEVESSERGPDSNNLDILPDEEQFRQPNGSSDLPLDTCGTKFDVPVTTDPIDETGAAHDDLPNQGTDVQDSLPSDLREEPAPNSYGETEGSTSDNFPDDSGQEQSDSFKGQFPDKEIDAGPQKDSSGENGDIETGDAIPREGEDNPSEKDLFTDQGEDENQSVPITVKDLLTNPDFQRVWEAIKKSSGSKPLMVAIILGTFQQEALDIMEIRKRVELCKGEELLPKLSAYVSYLANPKRGYVEKVNCPKDDDGSDPQTHRDSKGRKVKVLYKLFPKGRLWVSGSLDDGGCDKAIVNQFKIGFEG